MAPAWTARGLRPSVAPVAKDKKPQRVPVRVKLKSAIDGKKKVTVEVKPTHLTEDVGSFTFGLCTSCDWRGPGRRSRQKARDDVAGHIKHCKGKGEAVVTEGKVLS